MVKITSRRQVLLPAGVLEALGVGSGDQLELEEGADGFVLRPTHIDYSRLGTLSSKIPPDIHGLTSKPSGNDDMIRRYGIDTSRPVWSLPGDPKKGFEYCVSKIRDVIDELGSEIFLSNQVVAEAHVVVQPHYGVSMVPARVSLLGVPRSGLVSPLNGRSVIDVLKTSDGPRLFGGLIAADHSRAGVEVLALGRRIAAVPDARHL